MPNPQKLAIFDIDGTIALKSSVSEAVVEGMRHLRSLGFLTTFSTGRGYVRAKAVLGLSNPALIATYPTTAPELGAVA